MFHSRKLPIREINLDRLLAELGINQKEVRPYNESSFSIDYTGSQFFIIWSQSGNEDVP